MLKCLNKKDNYKNMLKETKSIKIKSYNENRQCTRKSKLLVMANKICLAAKISEVLLDMSLQIK